MFSENNRISGRQAFRLITYDLLGLSTLLVPAVLARAAGADGIFCIAAGVAAGLLYLKLLGVLVADMHTSYPEFLRQTLGNFAGWIVVAGYLIYFVLLAGFTAYLFADVILNNLLREESFYLVVAVVLLLVAYGLWSGIEGRARVYEILFWVIMIPLFLMLFCSLDEILTDYWTPVFMADTAGALSGSYYVFCCLSIVGLVLFLGGYMEKKKALLRAGRQALLFAGGIHGVLYLILLGIFGAKALGTMDYPAVTLMSTVKISGGFFKRTDAFMFAIWFFTLYALLNSCVFYGGNVLVNLTTGIFKQMKPQKKERMAFAAVFIAVLAAACAFYKERVCYDWYAWFFRFIGTPFFVLVPVLLLFCRAVKHSGQNREAKRAVRMIVIVVGVCAAFFMLGGCGTAELEERDFPIEVAVEETDNFAGAWYKTTGAGNRLVDYNHLKVMIINEEFIADQKAMEELLELLENENEVPRNTYVVAAKDAAEILALKDVLGESVGNYLEAEFENVSQVKKQAYPTLGMLYQEQENRTETLFIPYISVKEDKPVVEKYFVWKRGAAAGIVDNETAMLSYFTGDDMEDYRLSLADGTVVSLSEAHNQISFLEDGQKREIVVNVRCSGEVLGGEAKVHTVTQIASYMNDLAQKAMRKEIDVSNSYRKLGGMKRDWYLFYEEAQKDYEREMDIVYEVEIDWVNL